MLIKKALNMMSEEKAVELFSRARLDGFASLDEHFANFRLIQKLALKIGVLEIVTRNKIAKILEISDDKRISKKTFGYWCEIMNDVKIHNQVVNLDNMNFKDYSKFNKHNNMFNYQKVKIVFNLALTIRNRAFHFENLYKLNENKRPRISTSLKFGKEKVLVGVDPDKLEIFINDLLVSFDKKLLEI